LPEWAAVICAHSGQTDHFGEIIDERTALPDFPFANTVGLHRGLFELVRLRRLAEQAPVNFKGVVLNFRIPPAQRNGV
jgi:hypothetical protein